MGRNPSRWANLPRGMRARPRGNKVFYYLDTGKRPRKEIPLGDDYTAAVEQWSALTCRPEPETAHAQPAGDLKLAPGSARTTFLDAVAGYRKHVLPTKASATQHDNQRELVFLLRFFGGDSPAPLDEIQPVHIRQYLRWRVGEAKRLAQKKHPGKPVPDNLGHVRANREKSLFSHIWNYARGDGLTSMPNPCAGIKGFNEEGRDTVPDDALMQRALEAADKPLRFALRLAELTGQRPTDVRTMNESQISGGVLHVKQGKTKAKLRIVIEGALAQLLDEIGAYKDAVYAKHPALVRSSALLVTERGKPLSYNMLRDRFDNAREQAGIDKALFQFRDLRAKAATDTDETSGTRTAQAILGHTTETMTAHYIRHKAGKKVHLGR